MTDLQHVITKGGFLKAYSGMGLDMDILDISKKYLDSLYMNNAIDCTKLSKEIKENLIESMYRVLGLKKDKKPSREWFECHLKIGEWWSWVIRGCFSFTWLK